VLVLTDMVGATPANVAARLARRAGSPSSAGVNLPMLLRSLCYGELSLEAVLAKALDGGTKGVQQLPRRTAVATSISPRQNIEP
jgi:mannose PTS system EIIA component